MTVLGEPRRAAGDAMARFASDAIGLGLGFVGSVVLARAIGPRAVGALATMTFAILLVGRLASLGLGEAVVLLVRRERAPIDAVVAMVLGPTIVGGTVGGVLVAVGGAVTHRPFLSVAGIAIGGIATWLFTCERVAALAAVAAGDLRAPVTARVANAVVDVGVIVVVAIAFSLSVGAALVAFAAGTAAALAIDVRALRRLRIPLLPARLAGIGDALRLGLPQELSYLLLALVGRADLLVVVWLRGDRDAGLYSVALTMGQLVQFAPMAIAWAAYPRLADGGDGGPRAFRAGVTAAFAGGVAVACLAPIVITVAYGHAFAGAVVPALVLVAGGATASAQYLLARGWTATGEARLQVEASVVSLIVMLLGDLLLVPGHGLVGAAIASAAGSTAGLARCVQRYRAADRAIVGPMR